MRMESDEENYSTSVSPEKTSHHASITGFLFGNINKEGQLETNDVFDEVWVYVKVCNYCLIHILLYFSGVGLTINVIEKLK